MIKVLAIAAVLSLVCRWLLGRWPWDYLFAKPTRVRDVSNARKLLGVGDTASPAEIREAHRRLLARVHPDRGGSSAQVHQANDARDLLLSQVPLPPPSESDPR